MPALDIMSKSARRCWPTVTRCAPGDLSLRHASDGGGRLEDMSLEDVERLLIQKALARHQGNVSAAAKALGLSRSALYRRLERYGL